MDEKLSENGINNNKAPSSLLGSRPPSAPASTRQMARTRPRTAVAPSIHSAQAKGRPPTRRQPQPSASSSITSSVRLRREKSSSVASLISLNHAVNFAAEVDDNLADNPPVASARSRPSSSRSTRSLPRWNGPSKCRPASSTSSTTSEAHYGTKPGHFETSKIHYPMSGGVSERASKRSGGHEQSGQSRTSGASE